MLLLKVTAKRNRGNLETLGSEVVGEMASNEPKYWEPICEAVLPSLIKAGIVPPLDNKEKLTGTEGGV